MCGLVGFVSLKRKDGVLHEMLDIQSYRGPDDNGYFIDNDMGVHLGHNRLSIQDLSSNGHQPFISNCENYILVFNGEIYNYKEIRSDLIKLGYIFLSGSDTEVVLYSYKEWGIKCLDRFIGMFAFVIMDKVQGKLILSRDRAGVKPLYYYSNGKDFAFSSELKSFTKFDNFKQVINKDILPYYFQFSYIPAPHTIYNNCFKLKPGHFIEYDLDDHFYSIHKYWDITDFYLMDKFDKSEDQIIQEVSEILESSCKYRMISDVKTGVFLSGGFDSSLALALTQEEHGKSVNTFTVGFHDEQYNEANHAKKIADYLSANHTEYYCTEADMLDFVKKLPFYWDEPFADESALPTVIVSRLAKKDVTVALSADGGDEIFCGYSKYFAINKLFKVKKNHIANLVLKFIITNIPVRFLYYLNNILPDSVRQTDIEVKFQKFKSLINSEDLKDAFIRASSSVSPDYLENILKNGSYKFFDKTEFNNFSQLKGLDKLDQMMAIDYKTFLPDDVLCKVDRASMSVSLEGREPLLDHRIAEYMARVPSVMKYKKGIGKYILRQVLYKYIPKNIVDKPKTGFSVPIKNWLLGDLKGLAIESLESKDLEKDDIFHPEALKLIADELKGGQLKSPALVWNIIMYVLWRREWIHDGLGERG
jgi:asparagine synthase (glutamine-hydrolysing)